MGKYVTHAQMKKHLFKIKGVNDYARILGVDVGRKYTGLAISDK